MIVSSRQSKLSVLCVILAVLLSATCKPETPPNRAPQTGALISPIPTPLPVATSIPTLVSPLPTPVPTPWPPGFTPSPEPTPSVTPEGAPVIITDPVSHFSLQLPPGWHAYGVNGGEWSITNYDAESKTDLNNFQFGDIKIDIGVGRLAPGQSFQQWVSNRITVDTSPGPNSPMPTATATEPQLYTLGPYKGVTFYINGAQLRVMEINLLWGDQGVMVIDLMPADSPALSAALSVLSAIEFSPIPSP